MNMAQYRDFVFADSDRINFQGNRVEQTPLSIEEKEQRENALLQRLESGEISEAEYKTLTITNAAASPAYLTPLEDMKLESDAPQHKIDDSYWTDQLTDEDIQYLMLK